MLYFSFNLVCVNLNKKLIRIAKIFSTSRELCISYIYSLKNITDYHILGDTLCIFIAYYKNDHE